MLLAKKIIIALVSTSFFTIVFAQEHPNIKQIDSLKKLLPSKQGLSRIDCLNALSEEYWWPPKVLPDSISCWAIVAFSESSKVDYPLGLATSVMHLGVAELYRKNFLTAEKYLRQALAMFDKIHNERETGWCDLWLAQVLYGQNDFKDAIACYWKSALMLEKSGDGEGEGKAYAWMSFLYEATGDYDSSFYCCNKSLMIRRKMGDDICIAGALVNMGHLYKNAGAYDDALGFYNQSGQYANTHGFNLHTTNWSNIQESIGIVYRLMNKADSSLYYLNKALQIDPENRVMKVSLGETLLLKKQYDEALNIFLPPLGHFRKENDQWDLMHVSLDAAKAFQGEQNTEAALPLAREGLSIAQKAHVKPYMMQGYLLLSEIYNDLKQNDSAYFFIQKYIALKDSVANQQFLWRLTNYKKQNEFKKQIEQLTLLEKDNNINAEKLKNATMLKWFLISGLIIIAMSGIIVYRSLSLRRKNYQLKSEHEKATLKQNATELEMQALRAQMNPHFIFNALSAINLFILENNRLQASEYLAKFSRLVRLILQNSQEAFIPLDCELEALQLYLELEILRFENKFSYKIITDDLIDTTIIKVPPLIIQPYVENAIWHGLMHLPDLQPGKKESGHLEIELYADDGILFCKIKDNGVGRKKAAELKSKSALTYKSMGMTITADRIAMLQQQNQSGTHIVINDLVLADGSIDGTEVIIKIPF
ncbi:MAG: histidine kinase [Ginsengibacter sp.]